jgi:peptidylprolyl isomerase
MAFAASLILCACGSKSAQQSSADAAASPSAQRTPPSAGTSPLAGDSKPTVTIPDGPPPPALQVTDLRVGSGAEATAGKTVTVQYVGVAWSTRKQFDASWDRGQPFTFQLGGGNVIAGWDRGVVGMRVGGRRQLIIPPDLGYGAQGYPPDIGPNETLVFVIDLVSVQ